MTNKEALVAVLRINVPDNSLEKAMIDRGVTAADTYDKANERNIDLCAVDVLHGLLSDPNVSEGGYSISFDRDAVQQRLLLLAKKHNVSEIINAYKPTVTSNKIW